MYIPLWLLIPLAVFVIMLIVKAAQDDEARMLRLESSRMWHEEEEVDPYL